MRTALARLGVVCVVPLVAVSSACAGAARPDVSTPPPVVATAPVSSPANAVSLGALGYSYGPVDRVFIPADASISSRIDQTNNVAAVLTSPSEVVLAAFYRRTLVANGFTLTADDAATSTLTFAGFGWTGTFTGDPQASALLLRPAA